MNFATVLTAILTALSNILPLLLPLLNDPNFQKIVAAIEADLQGKIAAGVPSSIASQQATGLLGAAAMLHLTGNPVADFESFLKNLPAPAPPKFSS